MKFPVAMRLDEAHKLGWHPLEELLSRTGSQLPQGGGLGRTFVLWRSSRVVPPSIYPLRGWLHGRRTVLWPPELEDLLKDALRFRGYAHLKGQRHRVNPWDESRSHAGLRVLLWAHGWDYPLPLMRRSILQVIHLARKLLPSRDATLLDFLRWFFLSSKAFAAFRLTTKPRRSPKDLDRELAFESFVSWARVLTWAECDLALGLRSVRSGEERSLKEIWQGARRADGRLFDIARGQARRLVHALFRPVRPVGGQDVSSFFSSEQRPSDPDDWIAWSALRPVIPEISKIVRYLGLWIGAQVAALDEASLLAVRR